jgi:hypothetical protein
MKNMKEIYIETRTQGPNDATGVVWACFARCRSLLLVAAQPEPSWCLQKMDRT